MKAELDQHQEAAAEAVRVFAEATAVIDARRRRATAERARATTIGEAWDADKFLSREADLPDLNSLALHLRHAGLDTLGVAQVALEQYVNCLPSKLATGVLRWVAANFAKGVQRDEQRAKRSATNSTNAKKLRKLKDRPYAEEKLTPESAARWWKANKHLKGAKSKGALHFDVPYRTFIARLKESDALVH